MWYCKVVGYQAGTERVTSLVSQGHCGLSDPFCINCSYVLFYIYVWPMCFIFSLMCPFISFLFDRSLCGHLAESGPVHHLGDLYILPKFATVSKSTGLPCISVAWGGVEQWSDRNPKGTYQIFCKFRKHLKNTKNIKYEKYKKNILKHIGHICTIEMYIVCILYICDVRHVEVLSVAAAALRFQRCKQQLYK